MNIQTSTSRQLSYLGLAILFGVSMVFRLAVNSFHAYTILCFGCAMLVYSMRRFGFEKSQYSLEVFTVLSIFIFMLFMLSLTTVGVPVDVASILLTALSPKLLLMMMNYVDGESFNEFGEGYDLLSENFSFKMGIQILITFLAVLLVQACGLLPLVKLSLSFENLCAPLVLIATLPEIFYQNSKYNTDHSPTIMMLYGAMAVWTMLMGLNIYAIVLGSMAITGALWNKSDNFEIRALSWQSITAATLFTSTANIGAVAAGCVWGLVSAKAMELLAGDSAMVCEDRKKI
jgi:hypothetical protein